MTADTVTSFVTYYIRSLAERTRVEKVSMKFGFDWVIYNLALADDLRPIRLPFFRSGAEAMSKTKTEAEYGIDLVFLSPDGHCLTIFVLKAEALCNATWTAKNFDSDLRMAAAPNLQPPGLKEVQTVRVVLAYNQDEDQTGTQLFTNLVAAIGNKIGEKINLSFERWNLTEITERVKSTLLTPSLLPQKFFSLFSYICSQAADFRHGSDEWTKQLVPNWRRFLDDLLKENADERAIRLLPVALLILRKQGSPNLSFETGWIDLTEWAMLSAWRIHQLTSSKGVKQAILQMWIHFYLAELERFYNTHAGELTTEHSLATVSTASELDAIKAGMVALWHIGRMGLLALGYGQLMANRTPEEKQMRSTMLNQIANWLVGLLNANPAAKRPLLDIHHIEMFLIWRILWQAGRKQDIYLWLADLETRLYLRRLGLTSIPFIEGHNSLPLVFEHVVIGEKPPEFCDQSSVFLLVMIELCCSLDDQKRDALINRYYEHIALAQDDSGKTVKGRVPIDLMAWSPPKDWATRIFTQTLANDGESLTFEPRGPFGGTDAAPLFPTLLDFIQQSRSRKPFAFPLGLPIAALVLACQKHLSPLPPEFWRLSIFGGETLTQTPPGVASQQKQTLSESKTLE